MKGLPLVLNVKRLVDKCPLKERKVFLMTLILTYNFSLCLSKFFSVVFILLYKEQCISNYVLAMY